MYVYVNTEIKPDTDCHATLRRDKSSFLLFRLGWSTGCNGVIGTMTALEQLVMETNKADWQAAIAGQITGRPPTGWQYRSDHRLSTNRLSLKVSWQATVTWQHGTACQPTYCGLPQCEQIWGQLILAVHMHCQHCTNQNLVPANSPSLAPTFMKSDKVWPSSKWNKCMQNSWTYPIY